MGTGDKEEKEKKKTRKERGRGGGGEEGEREMQNAWELDQKGTEQKEVALGEDRDDATLNKNQMF